MSNENIRFDTKFIKHFENMTDFESVVKALSENLLSKQVVTNDYPNQVIKRESKFPTGLPTSPVGVAIPHTDPKYVNVNAISVGILKYPIEMTVMGTDDQTVDVSIVFLLSLSESNKQLNILKRIMTIVQDQETLKNMLDEDDKKIYEDVNKAILED